MPHVIYVLKCPVTLRVRYVGYTRRRIESRLQNHVAEARSRLSRSTPRLCWIRKLLSAGTLPVIAIIEHVRSDNWQERECYWIAEFGGMGKLLNCTTGGDGGNVVSEATKKKFSLMRAGKRTGPRSQEFRDKMSRILKGKKRPPLTVEHARKIGDANRGRKHSPEWCANISAGNIGRSITTENLAKLAAGRKAFVVTPEYRKKLSEAMMGHVVSQETRDKISATKRARKCL